MKTNLFCRASLYIVAFFVAIGVTVSSAHAGAYITPGTPAASGGAQVTVDDAQLFLIPFEPWRSYACSLVGSATDGNLVLAVGVAEGDHVRRCGGMTPRLSANSSTDADITNNRYCIISTTTQNFGISVDSAKTGGEPARFECLETTLYGGYNTNANPYNFLEILNISNDTIRGYVRALDYEGNLVINNRSFEVAPNTRADIDIHTAAGENKFGLVQVTHNGPYGAIQAYLSQYFGEPANPTFATTNPLRPRDQNL